MLKSPHLLRFSKTRPDLFLPFRPVLAHKSTEVNRTLARFAYKYGLTMAVGSLSAFFHDPGCRESFYVAREENPNGIILASVSCGTPVGLVREGVSILEASAVQVHLNTA